MEVFRSIMRLAASKRHIPESHVFRDKISLDTVRPEEFTPADRRRFLESTQRLRAPERLFAKCSYETAARDALT
jgi:hypothetical protein